jgi:hypothetical protein
MEMVGNKTNSIYMRYAIVDKKMHSEAAAKLDAFAEAGRRDEGREGEEVQEATGPLDPQPRSECVSAACSPNC